MVIEPSVPLQVVGLLLDSTGACIEKDALKFEPPLFNKMVSSQSVAEVEEPVIS